LTINGILVRTYLATPVIGQYDAGQKGFGTTIASLRLAGQEISLHALSESVADQRVRKAEVRIQVEIINARQLINYNKALRLVEKGYAAFVGDDRRKNRYLEHL